MDNNLATYPQIPEDIKALLHSKTPETATLHELVKVAKAFVDLAAEQHGWKTRFEQEHLRKLKQLAYQPEATVQHLRDKVRAYEKYMNEIVGEEAG